MLSLTSNLTIAGNTVLKNRVVVPPMASATSNELGLPTLATYQHYQRLAESHAGLIMAEYTFVHPYGRSEPNQLGLYSDDHMQAVKCIAQIIKASGAVSAIQLVHGGAKSSTELTHGQLIGPSSVIVPTAGKILERPRAATEKDIELMQSAFVSAALYAKQAGFDIVELHAAHGYGLNQWLSPITNKRQDEYGGTLPNRARMLFEIVEKLVEQGITLSVRIPGQDHFVGGLTSSAMVWVSQQLEARGVAIINVSSGIGGWRRPTTRAGEGYLVEDAEKIQQEVSIPVIGVGGIQTADYINEGLNNKRFSLAAVGRSILNDPQWGKLAGLE